MKRNLGRAIATLGVTAAAAAALAAGSGIATPYHAADASRLRLSWTARPERIEQCRALSDEELVLRPEHMRQRMECEGGFATYALTVVIDGRQVEDAVLRGGGVRNDRPIHDLRELDVAPGRHRVQVSLVRREADAARDEDDEPEGDDAGDDDSGISADRGERERTERARRQRAALPVSVTLDTTMVFRAGQVAVITFDAGARRFTGVLPLN
ncbi:MAG: hypothetical protein ACM357_09050 [Gemmatimonadota bacterium]